MQAELVLRSLHIQSPTISQLLSDQAESHEHLLSWQRQGIPFEDFCTLYAELKHLDLLAQTPGAVLTAFCYLTAPFKWLSSEFRLLNIAWEGG